MRRSFFFSLLGFFVYIHGVYSAPFFLSVFLFCFFETGGPTVFMYGHESGD